MQPAEQPPRDVIVTAGAVLTGPELTAVRDGAVRVRGDELLAVGPLDVVLGSDPRPATVLHYPEATLLPGLVDCHVHLAFGGDRDAIDTLRAQDDASLLPAMAGRAATMLSCGITTVRDLGDRAGLAVRLRELVRAGHCDGPRILAAGSPLTPPGGHCWFLGGEAGTDDELRAAVDANARAGADLVKVMASGGHLTPGGAAMWESQFSREQLGAVVARATEHGLPVAAHAHGTAAIADAVAAGVRTVEHCTWIGEGGLQVPDDVVERMLRDGVVASPAISRNWHGFGERFGEAVAAQLVENLRDLDARGVPVVAGTDAGIPGSTFDSYADALGVYTHAGIPPHQVLRMATCRAAEAIGLAGVTGSLATGHAADFVVVDGDPREDLSALRNVLLVAARGRLRPRAARSGGTA